MTTAPLVLMFLSPIRSHCKLFPTVAGGDSLDWKDLTASEISDRVLKKVKPGSIVLFHNAALHTPEALPHIIETLQKQGYKIVPVSQIILKDSYTIDNAGMQKAIKEESTEKKEETKPETAETFAPYIQHG